MKICYLHQHFTTPKGSGGTRSYEMARRLVDEGHDVTMICGAYGGGHTGLSGPFKGNERCGIVEGISVIEFDLRYSNADGFLKRVQTFLRYAFGATRYGMKLEYDLIFATTTPLTVGIPGIVCRWLRRKPFVFEVRDLWPELPRAMGVITNPIVLGSMAVLEWMSYKSAHRCIALSPGIRDGIAKKGVPLDRIKLVPNGCDISLFDEGKNRSWRPEGVAEVDLMAIFTGTHGAANGLDNVLNAAQVLKVRGRTDIKIVLVGQGKMKAALQERANRESLDNVIFHAPVSKERLTGLMASADLGIQSLANIPAFYYGTSPNKFFDYIASSLPVLNNYPGWVAELISENDCGFAVPPDDAEAFANALEDAANRRSELQQLGENAQKLAKQHFNRDDLGKRWVQWVTSTVHRS